VSTALQLNALTVDVEDYFHVAAFAGDIDAKDWPTLPQRVDDNTRRLLDILDEAGVSATFFVLGWVGERHPQLIREVHRRGHEVACHGFSHKLIYEQTPAEFRAETVRSKKLLEDLISVPVVGYRAASYSVTAASRWAMDIIAEAGFRYDSSIVPVHHDLYGIPSADAAPHRLVTERGSSIVEFPPTTYAVLGRRIPVAGGGYFRLYPYGLTRFFLQRINRLERRPFIFYLHPWEIDPGQPRIRSKLRSRFRHYMNLDKTEPRLRRLLCDFEFDTVHNVIERLGLWSSDGRH
jgi:polysaccharide deacetylase family protein (PEP-CTERM system associated)